MNTPQNSKEGAPARGLMPPHLVLRNFLDDETVAGLLDYTLSRQLEFAPTHLGGGAVDPSIRFSLGLWDLGPYQQVFKSRMLDLLPRLIAELRVTPFEASWVETELVAHNDGAFFIRHIDTQTGSDRLRQRVLSGVYYFHTKPKAFTGGALRLHDLGGASTREIEPAHNSLLAFPSWAPHEVIPVSCPSKRFADSRFAINCWLYREKPVASGDVK